MFICAKSRQNLSEIGVRTFERIQRVIWDRFLPLRVKLSRSKLYFRFGEQLSRYYAVCSVFSFVPFSNPPS